MDSRALHRLRPCNKGSAEGKTGANLCPRAAHKTRPSAPPSVSMAGVLRSTQLVQRLTQRAGRSAFQQTQSRGFAAGAWVGCMGVTVLHCDGHAPSEPVGRLASALAEKTTPLDDGVLRAPCARAPQSVR